MDIPVEIIRKPIRHMYLRVKGPDARVCISAPLDMDAKYIRAFLDSREAWILEQLKKISSASCQSVWPPAGQMIWGEKREVCLQQGRPAMWLEEDNLCASLPAGFGQQEWEGQLSAFLRLLVIEAATPVINDWRRRLGTGPVSWSVRRMQRRWGTCYPSRKKIILNSYLATKPRACLEQVIVHELLHFFEPNHGQAFKKRMDECLPGWRAASKILDQEAGPDLGGSNRVA